jgi:hypothetical protein
VSKSSGNLTKAFLLNNKRNPPKKDKKKTILEEDTNWVLTETSFVTTWVLKSSPFLGLWFMVHSGFMVFLSYRKEMNCRERERETETERQRESVILSRPSRMQLTCTL